MTFETFLLIVLAVTIGVISVIIFKDIIHLVALGVCLGWMRLQDWYNHGWLHKDGRKATFVPKEFLKRHRVSATYLIVTAVLIIFYIVVSQLLIH